jgi:glycolate oxidase
MNDGTPIRPMDVELGASGEEFQNLHEFVRKARANLNQNAWDYIVGAAETETTLRRNRLALDEIAFRPRVLRNVAKVDTSVEVFGRKRLPVMLAPVGALEMFDPDAGAAVARGAGAFGAAHMLSSVTEPGLEKTAEAAPDTLRIFQLYVRGGDAFVEDCVGRAIANGYTAFCLTVDTAHYSRRERDIAKRYVRASRVRATGRLPEGAGWRTVKLIETVQDPACHQGDRDRGGHGDCAGSRGDWIHVKSGGRQLTMAVRHAVLPKSLPPSRSCRIMSTVVLPGTDIVKAIAMEPILSASADCNAGRLRLRAKPASCGCWNCWRTR